MRGLVAVAVLTLATGVCAQELSVAEVLAAHRAGAPPDGILRLIRESPAVAALTASDLARLRTAGVPEPVIEALVARTARPTPTAIPSRPDDPRLVDVVRLVRAGLAEALVVEQLRRSGVRYAPTANDLVYLGENGVPEAVIAELLATAVPATPVPASPMPSPSVVDGVSFGPLLRMTGAFRKESTGILVVTRDLLEWRDARGGGASPVPTGKLKGFWLSSVPRGAAATVVELRVRTVAGDDLAFRDADWTAGGSAEVARLYRALEERFPQLVLRERAKR